MDEFYVFLNALSRVARCEVETVSVVENSGLPATPRLVLRAFPARGEELTLGFDVTNRALLSFKCADTADYGADR